MTGGRLPATACIALALLVAGCGGGEAGEEPARPPDARTNPAVIARANANCRQFLREAEAVAADAFEDLDGNLLELATTRIVRPTVPVLKRMASKQQALAKRTENQAFQLYAGLFDPIVVAAEERLRSGLAAIREGGGRASRRSKELEDVMTHLGEDQRDAARRAELPACTADFRKALVSSLSG